MRIARLEPRHKLEATRVLSAAFGGDPLIGWSFRRREAATLPLAFSVSLGQLIPAGATFGAFVEERLVGVAMYQRPGAGYALREAVAAGLLRLLYTAGLGGTTRLLASIALTERFKARVMGSEPYHYLDTLGVDPEFARRGVGSELARQSLAALAGEGLACLLLTHVDSNVRFYERLGFRVESDYRLPRSPIRFVAMVRRAS
jgi:ribosomal protein S18 acetylase RimI-like enzyme